MESLEELEQRLRHALSHLYDPTYHPPELLWVITGGDSRRGVGSVQAAIIQAIEQLRPDPDVPPNARIRRLYELLRMRYIQGLTQKETAQYLGITTRHVRREQREAVRVLAQRLWEQRHAGPPLSADEITQRGKSPLAKTPTSNKSEYAATNSSTVTAWRSQVRQELASLQQSAPGLAAVVGAAIRSAAHSGRPLASRRGIKIRVEPAQQDLRVAIHPSTLREVLITTIAKLSLHMSSGEISLSAKQQGESVSITVSGYPSDEDSAPQSDFIREALTTRGSSVEVHVIDRCIEYMVTLPSADKVTVLVVDDNADLVRFYQHYTARTRFHIVHVSEGSRVFETVAQVQPDIIVLDILLPDVDGWELLAQLREHPLTRHIPNIVCSVVRQEELALVSGAVLYLQKPVRRQQFIRALDQGLGQVQA